MFNVFVVNYYANHYAELWIIMNRELEGIWKKVFVACIMVVLWQYSLGSLNA